MIFNESKTKSPKFFQFDIVFLSAIKVTQCILKWILVYSQKHSSEAVWDGAKSPNASLQELSP